MTRARARWTVLAVLAALLGIGALTLDRDGLRNLLGGFTRASPSAEPREPLTADTPQPEGPRLEGARLSEPTVRARAESVRGPVTVRVSDRLGRALEGVHVVLMAPNQEGAAQEGVTDSVGHMSFAEDVPYDGSCATSVTSRDEKMGLFLLRTGGEDESGVVTVSCVPGSQLGTADVTGPDIAIAIDVGLPLEVDARDATDGRSLNVRWQATPRLEWAEETSGRATVAVGEWGKVELRIVAVAPPGSVAEPAETWSLQAHPQARRLLAVVPVRPEIEVIAQFPPEVLPFPDEDWNPQIGVAGHPLRMLELSVQAGGRIGIGRVPHFPGEHVVIEGTLSGHLTTSGRGTMDADPRTALVIPIACAEFPSAPLSATKRVRLESAFMCKMGKWGSPGFTPERQAWQTGSVNVRVWLPDGTVAAGAHVNGVDTGPVFTDRQGRVQFTNVPEGPVRISVFGAGAVTYANAEVKAGETTDLDVRTSAGGTIAVDVVDALGKPLPFAKLTIAQPSNLPWMDLDGDVQRVDPYTDVHGRRTLRTVEPGAVKVKATYGSRSAESEVTVVDGRTTRVRLVVRSPAPKEAPAEGNAPPAPPVVAEPVEAVR